MRKQLCLGLTGVIGVMLSMAVRADWPRYRGPNHDGSAATTIRTNWTSNPPRELWRIPLGPGWSSFATGGGRLFTQVRRAQGGSEREFAVALNPDTGETLWSTELGIAQYGNLVGYDDNLDGPRSTPTVDGDRVFILTSQMVLVCLRADTGAVIWRRDFIADLGASNIPWESAASPLVVGGMVIVNCNAPSEGSLLAASIGDGRTMWRIGSDLATHASPVLAQLHGETQVVFVTLSGLVGLNPQNGAARWRLMFAPSTTSTAASPVVSGDYVYASAAYARGAWTARVTTNGTAFAASEAWRQRGDLYQNHWATAVAYGGHLYAVGGPGPTGVRLVCIEASNGVVRWSQPTIGTRPLGYGSVLRVGDLLVVVNEGGEVVLVRADSSAYQQVGVHATGLRYCWNNPAIANGRIYLRNPEFALALDVAEIPPPLPPLRLEAAASVFSGALDVRVSSPAGPLDASVASRIGLEQADVLPADPSAWEPVPGDLVPAVDGTLRAAVPVGADRGFLRLREK